MKQLLSSSAVQMGKAFVLPVRLCEDIQAPALPVAMAGLLPPEQAHLQGSSVHCSGQVWLNKSALKSARNTCGFVHTYAK